MGVRHLLYHTRSRASVGCGGRLNRVHAARQHLRIAARRSNQASFLRAALEHGRVSNWRLRRVATQPCWRHFYYACLLTTRETEKKILPGFGLTKTGFPWWICGRTRQVIAEGRRILIPLILKKTAQERGGSGGAAVGRMGSPNPRPGHS